MKRLKIIKIVITLSMLFSLLLHSASFDVVNAEDLVSEEPIADTDDNESNKTEIKKEDKEDETGVDVEPTDDSQTEQPIEDEANELNPQEQSEDASDSNKEEIHFDENTYNNQIEEILEETEVFDPFDPDVNLGELLSSELSSTQVFTGKLKTAKSNKEVLTYEWYDELVSEAIDNRTGTVSIDSYNVLYSNDNITKLNALQARFKLEHPEYFYVNGCAYRYYGSGNITDIIIRFNENYFDDNKIAAFNAKCNEILAGIDDTFSDTEKALYLHDYIVTHCYYDFTYSRYTAYDTLVDGTSVCQGYSLALEYLLRKAGVGCDLVICDEMNHAWNSVVIDGKYYFVDATWDDPNGGDYSEGSYKSVPWYRLNSRHSYFLIDCDNLDNDHTGTDWINSKGENVRYSYTDRIENDFWSGVGTAIPHIGREWLYYKLNDSSFYTYNFETDSTKKIEWNYPRKYVKNWNFSYTGLASYGKYFYVSNNDTVFRLTTDNYAGSEFATLTDEEKEKGWIYGICVDRDETGSYLMADIATGYLSTNYVETKQIPITTIRQLNVLVNESNNVPSTAKIYVPSFSEKLIRYSLKFNTQSGTPIEKSSQIGSNAQYGINSESDYYVSFAQEGYIPCVREISNLNDNEEITLVTYGDANGDGKVDVADLSLTSSYILSSEEIVNESTDAADYDRNSVIDVKDLALISNRILSGS